MAFAEVISPDQAVAPIGPGAVLMVGGFGLVGAPLTLIDALQRAPRAERLTVISNNVGQPGEGLGVLLRQGRLARAIGSFFTSNPEVLEARRAGRIEVELLPQGTLAEAIRAGGAGIAAFYTRTGAGTDLAVGREEREFAGESYLMQESISADFALVRAERADRFGNLAYHRTARNFNPEMATAGEVVVAEVDEIVDELAPEEIHTPYIYVDQLVEAQVRL
jgi:3-oxoacid CoA-transferase subunit A/3-oxoadipate CoA-transferase alpha subunit